MKPTISQKDFYSRQAKKENYPARSVYKLKEIDKKYQLIRQGHRVLDLGCAPGSWLKYLAEKVGLEGKVVGIDLAELKIPLPANAVFIKKDIFAAKILSLTELQEKFQTVVSDLAPKTSGIKFEDAYHSLLLAQRAFKLAQRFLKKGGNFLVKIFEGEDSEDFYRSLKKYFRQVVKVKPKASYQASREFYILGLNFLGVINKTLISFCRR